MSDVRSYIFDKDGTLTDIQSRWGPVFVGMVHHLAAGDDDLAGRLADAFGVDLAAGGVIPNGLAAVGNGHELGVRAAEVLLGDGAPVDGLEDRLRAAFRSTPNGPLVPLGEVAATMESLAARGVRLGLATADSRDNALRELADLGIAHLIDEVRCGNDGGPVKPDPEVLWSICRAWRLDVAEVAFVGDSVQDLRCAEAAGMRFVAVGEIGAERDSAPDQVVADISALV